MLGRKSFVAGLVASGMLIGAAAGLEAGQSMDGFYTAPREPKHRALERPERPPSAFDSGSATFAASPPPGIVWGQEVGREERALFVEPNYEETRFEEPAYEEPAVRVHRVTVREVEPAVEQAEPVEEPVDGWVDAPTNAERLPGAG